MVVSLPMVTAYGTEYSRSHEGEKWSVDDRQFAELLAYLGRSWKGYRKVRKGVKKRITRHMQQLGCRSMDAYLNMLEADPGARNECEQLMGVSISRFFRDRRLWEVLETRVMPALIHTGHNPLRAWCAGCACGEEVYSLRMVWDRLPGKLKNPPELKVTGTDMNPVHLERARAGVYPISSLKEVPGAVREKYFRATEDGKGFQVAAFLQSGIAWQCMDLRSVPIGPPFHLILLRNGLLTYYEEPTQITVLRALLECLATGGYLIIGSHERLPADIPDLVQAGPLPYLFELKGSRVQGSGFKGWG